MEEITLSVRLMRKIREGAGLDEKESGDWLVTRHWSVIGWLRVTGRSLFLILLLLWTYDLICHQIFRIRLHTFIMSLDALFKQNT